MLGASVSHVSRAVSLLKLDSYVQTAIAQDRLSHTHGRELLVLKPQDQRKIAEQAITNDWTTRQLTQAIDRLLNGPSEPRKAKDADALDPNLRDLSNRLAQRFGAPVTIKHNSGNGTGSITFKYHSLDECDGILEKLGVKDE